jgi:hypothetical protein
MEIAIDEINKTGKNNLIRFLLSLRITSNSNNNIIIVMAKIPRGKYFITMEIIAIINTALSSVLRLTPFKDLEITKTRTIKNWR